MAKKRRKAGAGHGAAHEPEPLPDVPLPEPGDHVRLCGVQNAPTMAVESLHGPNNATVRCRWFGTTGAFYEREFPYQELESAEQETDGRAFHLPGQGPPAAPAAEAVPAGTAAEDGGGDKKKK